MSDQAPERTTEQTGQSGSAITRSEAELEQAILGELQLLSAQGLTLPPSLPVQPPPQQPQATVVTPITTTAPEGAEPVAPASTQESVLVSSPQDADVPQVPVETKKRRIGDDLIPGSEDTDMREQPSQGVEKPGEVITTVAELDAPPVPAKLTVEQILLMSVEDIGKLNPRDVAHIEMPDLVRARASQQIKSAFRPLKDPSVRVQQVQQQARKRKNTSALSDFNAVKNNIKYVGSWNKHYDGTEKGDKEFTQFLRQKRYSTKDLIQRVIGSSRVEEGKFCTFTDSDREHRICEVSIDLYSFYDNEPLLRGNTISVGVTDKSLEVFHAGPWH